MQASLSRLREAASVFLLGALAACGGRTTGNQAPAGGGTQADAAVSAEQDGGACVTVDPASYDDSCTQDSDCITIATGQLCPGACLCGDTPINTAGLVHYQAATASLRSGSCKCTSIATVCLANKCSVCPNGPGGCTRPVGADAEVSEDAGAPGNACVDLNPLSYSATCGTDSDCVLVTTGVVCSSGCNCSPNTAISQQSLPAYEAATASLPIEACNCPAFGRALCLPEGAHSQASCAVCGLVPNRNPACPDGG